MWWCIAVIVALVLIIILLGVLLLMKGTDNLPIILIVLTLLSPSMVYGFDYELDKGKGFYDDIVRELRERGEIHTHKEKVTKCGVHGNCITCEEILELGNIAVCKEDVVYKRKVCNECGSDTFPKHICCEWSWK